MKQKIRKDPYKLITDIIVSKLEEGTVPWKRPWSMSKDSPKNIISSKDYNGVNIWVLMSMGYTSRYWGTFKQISDAGGKVVKGQKGTPVVFWNIRTVEDKETGDDKKLFTLRYWTVFNLDQTEGIERPEDDSGSETNDNPFQDIQSAQAVVENMPNRPRIDHAEQRAYYNPARDFVNMPKPETFNSPVEYYSTLFHELSHSTGHESRLNREGITNHTGFGSHGYSVEELIAEFSASYIMGSLDLLNSTVDNSAAYIKSWIKVLKENPKYLISASSKAVKSADYILDIKKEEL